MRRSLAFCFSFPWSCEAVASRSCRYYVLIAFFLSWHRLSSFCCIVKSLSFCIYKSHSARVHPILTLPRIVIDQQHSFHSVQSILPSSSTYRHVVVKKAYYNVLAIVQIHSQLSNKIRATWALREGSWTFFLLRPLSCDPG